MWIMANEPYRDIVRNEQIAKGDVYCVSNERGATIIRAGYAHEVLVMTPEEHDAAIEARVMLAIQARNDQISTNDAEPINNTPVASKPRRTRNKAE